MHLDIQRREIRQNHLTVMAFQRIEPKSSGPWPLVNPGTGDRRKKPGAENFNIERQVWLPASNQKE